MYPKFRIEVKNIDLTEDLTQLDQTLQEFGPAIILMDCAQHYIIIDEVAKDHSTVTIRDPDRAIMAKMNRLEFIKAVRSPNVQLKLITQKK